MSTSVINFIKPSQIAGSDPQANKYLIVPIFIFFALLIFAGIRGPQIISSTGIGSAIIVITPLILATLSLTALAMAGRVTVDLSIGPLIGFINVTCIQLYGAGYLQHPVSYFVYALIIGVIYQFLYALIVIFVRVQPIIIALSMFLAFSGLNLVILPRPGGVAPDWMLSWGAGTTIIQPVLILLVFSIILWYLITHTAFWQHLKLMGSDEKSAYTSGVRIYWVRIGAHIIGGIYAALASIAFTSLISSGDPTQGTTYTLMAVTSLVLGGASLVGGRGGALGAILGSLNIYLINFILSTFRFERFQSFASDLAYGGVLVLSLLILLALPYIQKLFKSVSVFVFFILGLISATTVIIHMQFDIATRFVIGGLVGGQSKDQAIYEQAFKDPDAMECLISATACASDGSGTAGTIWFFVILGIAAVLGLAYLLVRFRNGPALTFLIAVIVIVAGCIFSGTRVIDNFDYDLGSNLQYVMNYYPQYFSMESFEVGTALPSFQNSSLLVSSTYLLLTFVGIVFFASCIIIIATPTFNSGIKARSLIISLVGISLLLFAAVSYYGVDSITRSFFGIEGYITVLVCLLLFLLTAPTIFSNINLTNIMIVFLGIIALLAVYFLGSPSNSFISDLGTTYFKPIIREFPPINLENIKYLKPIRGTYMGESISDLKEISMVIFFILFFQLATYLAMRGNPSFKNFKPYISILVISSLLWTSMFYAIGYQFWKILLIVSVTVPLAPLVWQAFNVYRVKLKLEGGLEKWGGFTENRLN